MRMDAQWWRKGPHLFILEENDWPFPSGRQYARVEQRLGKWTLEMYRPEADVNLPWEFVRRFDDLEEAKRVGYTLARIEN